MMQTEGSPAGVTFPPRPSPRRRALLRVLYTLAALAVVSAGFVFRSDLQRFLFWVQGAVGAMGMLAPAVMILVCGIWGTLLLPGPLMQATVATMFFERPDIGLLVVVAGEGLSQTIAFLLARHGGRERVKAMLADKAWFARLEEETARRGVYGVFLFRLMPFCPNALGSYAFGLTSLRFAPYLAASVLGSIPKMVVYIYGGTSLLRLVGK